MENFEQRHVFAINAAAARSNVISISDSELALEFPGENMTEKPDVSLVVRLDISNYKVRKVLIDGGSSGNII